MSERRWDIDEHGTGVADGSAFREIVEDLLKALATPGWVAEQPEAHLLPHFERHCAAPGSHWEILSTQFDDSGVFDVVVRWKPEAGTFNELRNDVFALIATVGEPATHIHQRVGNDEISFDVVLGVLNGQSHFKSHGHLVRLRASGPAVDGVIAGTRPS
jgi:hypothetical protein